MRPRRSVEIIGWLGAAAIFVAYILISFNYVTSHNLAYHLLNLLGSICIIVTARAHHDYQPFVLNIIWAGIALTALIRIFAV